MTAIATTATQSTTIAAKPSGVKRLAIVVRDDAFDRLLTPLTFAYEMGRRGVQVDVLFVLWAARVLTREGVEQVQIDPRYAHRKEWLLGRLAELGEPTDLHGFLQAAHETGNVRFHACRLAAATFGVTADNLLPLAHGITDPSDFLNTIALKADHCQYF
jgi:peroxiredoxin family protein